MKTKLESKNVVSYFIVILIAVILLIVLATEVATQVSNKDFEVENTDSLTQTILADDGTATTLTLSDGSSEITSLSATRLNTTWLDFDGDGDWVNLTNSGDLSNLTIGSNVRSILIRFKPYSFTGTRTLLARSDGIGFPDDHYNIKFVDGNNSKFIIGNGTGLISSTDFINYNFSESIWYDAAFIDHLDAVRLYVNGSHKQSIATINQVRNNNSNATLGIGRTGGYDGQYFNGSIAYTRLHNNTLSDLQIRIIKNEYILGKGIPILMYHDINNTNRADGLNVNLSNFADQLKYLNDSGFEVINFNQFLNWRNNIGSIPNKPIILTFDDAYVSQLNIAAQNLSVYGWVGSIAVNVDYINKESAGVLYEKVMNWTQVQEIVDIYNWEIISHGYNHSNAIGLNIIERQEQFELSKSFLETQLGVTINTYIFPGNSRNSSIDDECLLYYDMCTGNSKLVTSSLTDFVYKSSNLGGMFRVQMTNETIVDTSLILQNEFSEINVDEGLISDWNLNENQGTIAYDSSGNSNNGTISGATWNNDGITITLTNLVDYSLSGNIFTILNDDLSWNQIVTSYDDIWYTTFGFHLTIIKLTIGFICLGALSVVILYLLKILKENNDS